MLLELLLGDEINFQHSLLHFQWIAVNPSKNLLKPA